MAAFMTSNLSYEHLRKIQLVSGFFSVLQDKATLMWFFFLFFFLTATSSIRASGAHWSFESSRWGCTSFMHCKHVTSSAFLRQYREIFINSLPNSRFQIFRSQRHLHCLPIVPSLHCRLHRRRLLVDHAYRLLGRAPARHHQSQAIERTSGIGM